MIEDEPDAELKTIRNIKAEILDEIPPEKWKTKKFDDIHFRLWNIVYEENQKKLMKATSSFSKRKTTSESQKTTEK